ncbi:hypothetical protein GCM10022251_67740 [Phytohabitans flavus]|uniref:Uncharacterized protein n=1 Tax=Phytohabitans flavus TaxID=1076124 RepID=A0A6F8Y4Y0_9ACTN|nr:hypothetical protein [Phytohabitans flavus]BCB81184.1 hypothetical protein Pflav_075940 [Phytohabitans flavus]
MRESRASIGTVTTRLGLEDEVFQAPGPSLCWVVTPNPDASGYVASCAGLADGMCESFVG